MPLKPLFDVFLPQIEEHFAAAKADGGSKADHVTLEISEDAYLPGPNRAEFLVIEITSRVRITWNGIASLWLFAQAAGRLCRLAHEGNRNKRSKLMVDAEPELRRSLDSIVFSRRLLRHTPTEEQASRNEWPDWAPEIDVVAPDDSDTGRGNKFFLGALGWVLRHEVAHVVLDHTTREAAGTLTSKACETEADLQATKWLKGSRKADQYRPLGQKPQNEELELEWRGFVLGIGLLWVATMEADTGQPSDLHPPVAERLEACIHALKLRDDSFAKETLADFIQAWLAPERDAPVLVNHPAEAFTIAVIDLHRMMTSPDKGSWTDGVA